MLEDDEEEAVVQQFS